MILKDKVVIITGAGPGMGQAMCRGAAAEGARVVPRALSMLSTRSLTRLRRRAAKRLLYRAT